MAHLSPCYEGQLRICQIVREVRVRLHCRPSRPWRRATRRVPAKESEARNERGQRRAAPGHVSHLCDEEGVKPSCLLFRVKDLMKKPKGSEPLERMQTSSAFYQQKRDPGAPRSSVRRDGAKNGITITFVCALSIQAVEAAGRRRRSLQ